MKTKALQQTVTFKASPRQAHDMLMDWKKHQSLSSQPAKISRKVGGKFTAWGSQISGFYGRDVCFQRRCRRRARLS